MKLIPSLFLAAAASALGTAHAQDLKVANVFGDHMVLQREAPIPVWGTAAPGTEVSVRLGDGDAVTVTAGQDGAWEADLPSRPAGGPFTLAVSAGGSTETVSDVLVGDVILCSGQSNMAWPMGAVLNAGREVPANADPMIRLLRVNETSATTPQDDVPTANGWQPATPESMGNFSGVCYYTAKNLKAGRPDVPFGLIHSAWGGTRIESWVPAEQLREAGDFGAELDALALYETDPVAAQAGFGETVEAWWAETVPDAPVPWDGEVEDWQEIPANLGDYNQWDAEGMAGWTGFLWYKSAIDLTADQAAAGATLNLGQADDVDYVWLNGNFVGASFGWGVGRTYQIPADYLTEGENVLTVGVSNSWGAGGLTGPKEEIALRFEGQTDAAFTGDWSYWKAPRAASSPPTAPWFDVGGLTNLHNAMIAPLGPIPVKLALWYQGESNAGDAEPYKDLLAGLAAGWRAQFGDHLPIVVAQLPGYGNPLGDARYSGWSGIREAQREAAMADDKMGLAVLIDAGIRYDIHPPNKKTAGERMAAVAENLAYGDGEDTITGAEPVSAERTRRRVQVRFDNDGSALVAAGGMAGPFWLCGEDASTCEPVPASVTGEQTVELEIANGRNATRVRYCWGDAPICTLYTEDGAPVGPFEMPVE